jgi:hypothetical protein
MILRETSYGFRSVSHKKSILRACYLPAIALATSTSLWGQVISMKLSRSTSTLRARFSGAKFQQSSTLDILWSLNETEFLNLAAYLVTKSLRRPTEDGNRSQMSRSNISSTECRTVDTTL